jgi:hypothetical protein
VVSKRLIGLQLEIPPEDAIVACRAAIRSLEWELAESGEGRLTARQDAARLPCRDWPAEIEVGVGAAPGERTMLTLAGFVPGRGPLSSRHLRASLGVLEDAIRRRIG